jgi:hypothetical protein
VQFPDNTSRVINTNEYMHYDSLEKNRQCNNLNIKSHEDLPILRLKYRAISV